LVLLFLVLVAGLFGRAWLTAGRVPASSVLLFDLGGAYAEAPPADGLGRVFRRREHTMWELLDIIREASRDPRITALVLRVTPLQIGWAKAQEIRDALSAFKASGKRLVAYLEQEISSGNLEYYVASVAHEVYLPPSATAPLSGLLSQFFFLGGVWDKLDVEMQVEKIREYKTAGDVLANKSMSAAHREMANSLLDSINEQLIAGIAGGRDLDVAAVRHAIDACPIDPQAFAERGLSDGVRFLDEIRTAMVGRDGRFLGAAEYQPRRVTFPVDRRPEVAVIYAAGPIHTGEGGGAIGSDSVGANTVVDAFEKAAADDDVRAIVLRVDSPGGSALASDLIWRATQPAQARKPVIVSMSDVAASGGYYIAAGANKIVAQPGTLTGSIGVVMAKPNVKGFLAKLGVTTETLTRGKYARLEDTTSSLTPDERAKVIEAMEHIYDVFVERVAAGRQLSREQVHEVGRGRVWTGEQAKERGLVDEIGGFTRAIELAKQVAGLPLDQEAKLVFYPRRKSLFERAVQYLDARSTVSLPAEWYRAAATLVPLTFPDGSILTLMGEVIEIR
jgi:protease-4